MSTPGDWRPLQQPRRPLRNGFVTSPFTLLARTHALLIAGDTLVALGLAGSLFFSLDPSAARPKVALYLFLTVAPFAVVAPLIGPAIDRLAGGRKLMVIVSGLTRAVVCALMVGHMDSLLLFPEAFVVMVAAKGYAVAKSAIVPGVVATKEELVEANSKLQLIAGVVGFGAGVPMLPFLALDLHGVVMGLAALCFLAAAVSGLQLPSTRVAASKPGPAEVAELRGTGIIVSASAMGLLRATVGFLTFQIAFSFRSAGVSTAWFGVVIALSGIGQLAGAGLAPIVRRHTREEAMIIQVLVLTSGVGLLAAWGGGTLASAFLACAVGLAAAFAKLAFDSIVQRDAPDANQGRSFARFETRFQLGWVVGAAVPVVVPIPARIGLLIVAVVTGFAAATYLWGLRYLRTTGQLPPTMRARLASKGLLPHVSAPGASIPSWLRRQPGRVWRRRGDSGDPGAPAGSLPELPAPGTVDGPVSTARSPLGVVLPRRSTAPRGLDPLLPPPPPRRTDLPPPPPPPAQDAVVPVERPEP